MAKTITEAFFEGRDAYKWGNHLSDNPYYQNEEGKFNLEFAKQWDRGYKNTRKQARFDATIAARKSK